MYTLVVLNKFSLSWNRSLELFIFPVWNSVLVKQQRPPSTPRPCSPAVSESDHSLYLSEVKLWSICPFVVGLFHGAPVLRAHPCCSPRQDLLPSSGWLTPLWAGRIVSTDTWAAFTSRCCEWCCREHECADVLKPCFQFFGCMPRGGAAASCGNSVLSFWRNLHTVFRGSYTILQSHQWCTSVPVSLHPQ